MMPGHKQILSIRSRKNYRINLNLLFRNNPKELKLETLMLQIKQYLLQIKFESPQYEQNEHLNNIVQ